MLLDVIALDEDEVDDEDAIALDMTDDELATITEERVITREDETCIADEIADDAFAELEAFKLEIGLGAAGLGLRF